MNNHKNNELGVLKHHHNINKNAQFTTTSKAERLYGLEPIWLVTLKIGLTGLLVSFFGALFTFVDQLMLVNFMPDTYNFCFNNLFFHDGNGVFNEMLDHIEENGGQEIVNDIVNEQGTDKNGLLNLVSAIANSMGLTIYTSAGVVRSAVSLTGALSIIINAVPSLFAVGTSVKYTQALGSGNYHQAIYIWQNAFVGCITSGLICFVILLILIPTVIPLQAVVDHLSNTEINDLYQVITTNFNDNHWDLALVFNNHTNPNVMIHFLNQDGTYHYYAQVAPDKYLDLDQFQLMQNGISNKNLVSLNPNQLGTFQLSIMNGNGSILNTWNAYYSQVRTYSILWAENFMFIMDAGCTLFALANTLSVILRSDGAITMTTIIYVLTVIFNIILDFIFIKIVQIGMEGAATATVIGWIVQTLWYSLYLQYSTKLISYANFKYLSRKYLNINQHIMLELILFGLSMLVGSVTFSIYNIILTNQVSYVTVAIIPQVGSEYYLSVLGAVTPIINLFFFTIFGLVRGVDPIFSYNYSAHKYNRVRQAYWWNISFIVALGIVVFGLIGFCVPIRDGILAWFQIDSSSPNYQLATASKLIWVWLMQIPIMGLATGGMFVYRSTDRLGTAYLVALLRSCIFNIPVLFIFMAIAINCKDSLNINLSASQIDLPQENNAMWFFFYNAPVATACYSLTIFIMTTIFLYKYLDQDHQRRSSEIWPLNLIVKHHYEHVFNEVMVH